MGVASGPNVISSGLVFAIDTASPNSISGLGCTGFNNAQQLVKDLITKNRTITSFNGVRLTNPSFYTVFGISYPESSYGGDGANRHGITPGYNVRSGSKTYDASRSLHMWVWNEDTQAWVADSYFTGLRLSGHCYDNWSGYGDWQIELNRFNADLDKINKAFPNCTYIICGSHAAQNYDTATINNLISLGAPSGTVSSWTNNAAWREFVLVGKPGLGSGNAHGWVFENYSTNATEVAHLNFGLPAFGNNDSLDFDGTDDYISMGSLNLQQNWTLETICYMDNSDSFGIFGQGIFALNQGLHILYTNGSRGMIYGMYGNDNDYQNNYRPSTGRWYHWVFTYNHSTYAKQFYADSILQTAPASVQNQYQGSGQFNIGAIYSSPGSYANGRFAVVRMYDRVLSASEVLQNFEAQRGRFGI
jgi:hypothetical protein